MELADKIRILADSAKYDVSCSSSGSSRKNVPGGIGNGHVSGICHSWSSDGRCISLLKILLSNECIYNCTYCVNRVSNDIPRASFTTDELVDLTIGFYRRNYIEGLFLSSAILKSPDHTMEIMLQVVQKLRLDYRFNGYIHLKAIPGADFRLMEEAGKFADRMSVNIELPSDQGLKLLAPQKNQKALLQPMGFIHSQILDARSEKTYRKKSRLFVPAGQTTQLIVGATPDPDLKILNLSQSLYKSFFLKRVYYSAYVPVRVHPNLPAISSPPLLREHRLYQADWLLRFYGFDARELLNEANPNFDPDLDPKSSWALKNLHLFPVEINRAGYEMLLRVPGIGVRSAQRIITARKVHALNFDGLSKLGIVMKRARYFITCQGKFCGDRDMKENTIKQGLLTKPPRTLPNKPPWEQLSLFSFPAHSGEDFQNTVLGEL
ncbi:putative DNA modification/repair radical SAM protein [Candidatus Formimonas warabiya]|uniref:Putative DNA modification/repair radical SAM protein n=1 Tax=Formimonas warabiya TaxID=1761012 RepID=A0A3G1KS20_FORW1|nr:putative DNA modification/repair radical SAM protein [Candidatus Formimonas warabiya]ATW25184.1 putative DNA modification/repair radical SAM protein [Candidatus Formimonas warabiya]